MSAYFRHFLAVTRSAMSYSVFGHLWTCPRLHPDKINVDFFASICGEFPCANCEHFCSDRLNPDLLRSN